MNVSPSDPDEDGAERWGRRIGRALGYVFALLLLLNLFTHWF